MNLAEVWGHLEEDTRITEASGRVQRRIVPAGRRNFFLGLEMPARNRMLILRVSGNSAEKQPEVPDSRGLTVRVVRREAESNEVEVELVLTDSEHRDIFDLLVRDLVEAAEQPENEGCGIDPVSGTAVRLAAASSKTGPAGTYPRESTGSLG